MNTTNLWIHPAWSTVQAAAGQCVSVCGDNVLFCTCGHLIPPERGVVADHVHPFIATAFHLLTTHMSPRAASPDTMMSSVKSTVSRSQSKRSSSGMVDLNKSAVSSSFLDKECQGWCKSLNQVCFHLSVENQKYDSSSSSV